MGHNFGMSHDFDDKHGGTAGAYNGQGIMSYGDYLAQWSDCSVSDFTGYYENQLWGEKCLASKCSDRLIPTVLPTLTCNTTYPIFIYLGWDAYCGDECPNCNLNPNTICENPDWYGGCNGRYKSYFEAYCAGTCGFC